MKRSASLTAILALIALPSLAAANDTVVVRGIVFECDTNKVLTGAAVQLWSVDGTVRLRTDDRGRFTLLGVTPGAWTISASAPIPGKPVTRAVTRYATLRPGDVVDVSLGVFHDPLAQMDAACQWPRVVVPDSPFVRYTL